MSPRVTCLTPPGSAAIAVLEVAGEGTWLLVRKLFRPASKPLPETPITDGVWFGRIGPEPGDEAILSCPSPPASGGRKPPDDFNRIIRGLTPPVRPEATVEIHCHGGRQMVRTLIDLFVSEGCVEEKPSEPQTAWDLLPHAKTIKTASILLDQANGAFDRALEKARIDPTAAERLLDLADVGLHLVEPWKVVIAGAPNAGKSSLLNALAGYQRSIVTPVAGTTRDVVTTSLAFDGWPVDISDTAGLRTRPQDEIERAGIERSFMQIREADLCVWLIDGTAPFPGPKFLVHLTDRVLEVVNKIDLATPPAGQHLTISAQTGAGIDVLMTEMIRMLVPLTPEPGEGVPFNAECVAAVTGLRNP